jgi:uncharacterized protein (TIGR01732 family)
MLSLISYDRSFVIVWLLVPYRKKDVRTSFYKGEKNGCTIADFFKQTGHVQSRSFSKNIIIVRLEIHILNFSSEVIDMGYGGGNNFVLIVVLFILLIIVGATFVN